MKNTNEVEEVVEIDNTNGDSSGCQVRRRIEDYLERRRSKDELGELDEEMLVE